MAVVVLGASGGTGRRLVDDALARGYDVRALVRNAERAALAAHDRLEVRTADVRHADSITGAIGPGDWLLSGLGVPSKAEVGTLTLGARAVVAARPARIVWLGAMGTGASSTFVNAAIAWTMRKGFGPEYDDKVTADTAVLTAGGIVVHSGPLSDKSDTGGVALEPIERMPHQFFPAGAPRATLARLMLDAAADPAVVGGLLAVHRPAKSTASGTG